MFLWTSKEDLDLELFGTVRNLQADPTIIYCNKQYWLLWTYTAESDVSTGTGKVTSNELSATTNLTATTGFFLLGFQGSQLLRNFLLLLFLLVYNLTLCGNLLIITLVSTSRTLRTPMYFFISQLSISDILLTTNIVPNLLHILLYNGAAITFIGCFTQFYFFGASEAFECFLLTVMSYDRYVAICNPLHYTSLITHEICLKLVSMCWCLGFFSSFILTITPSKLNFCGPNIIDHLFCDLVPLLELSCSDNFIVHLELDFLGAPIVLISTIIIVASYTSILRAVLRIPSNTGRQKVFSTCSSHLIVVSIFYRTLFGVYVIPARGKSPIIPFGKIKKVHVISH
ncbi:olfactory receptor 5G9-like [Leptodactylus fuscus]|uniref:olfactory receptor 5G9-like n=1 Tax=Leptodactylus fuscus TaxID=238119 RepID=UPI003F4EDC72